MPSDTPFDFNPWKPFGLLYTLRDGVPFLAEASLWQLMGQHPKRVERVGKDELYVHLEQPYRVLKAPDRSFYELVPVPGRPPPAGADAKPKAPGDPGSTGEAIQPTPPPKA